ncbi:MAG: amino acid adenylation domain-containing protein, partial [Maioricimonas sp. JB049]
EIAKQEKYWLETFGDEVPVLQLPTDYARASVQSFRGKRLRFELAGESVGKLKQLAQETDSSLYMVLLASFQVLLAKYAGQEDIVVGSPIAGRKHPDLERVIGMFVNTLAMRNQPEAAKGFREFVKEVKQNALQAYAHQDYPFDELVQKLNIPREPNRNPLFDAWFVYQNLERTAFQLPDVAVTTYPIEHEVSRYDLRLSAWEHEENCIRFNLQFCTDLFKLETAERMAKHLLQVLREATAHPDRTIGELELVDEAERQQLVVDFNATAEPAYPQDRTLASLFEEQVRRTPDKPAVWYEGETLTYAQLNERANRLAYVLQARGVAADQPVALLVERSVEMLVSMLGVLKAGGAYVPMDPNHPEERLRYVLDDSGARVLLTQQRLSDKAAAAGFTGQTVLVDDEALYVGLPEEAANPPAASSAENLAYIIYTSGTTGKPKGVMVEQRSVVNLALGLFAPLYEAHPAYERMAQLAPYVFDMSVKPIYGSLLFGRTLYIVPEAERLDGVKLLQYFQKHAIDVVDATPTYLSLLSHSGQASGEGLRVKQLIVGGESLTVSTVRSIWETFGADVQLMNVYGPTECTVDATRQVIAAEQLEERKDTVPIGRPLANQQVWILDGAGRLQPIGVAGEIHISGAGVARGYKNRAELTAEKFVDNPYLPGRRMYRTGDLGRWLPDGTIEYMGRIDDQVKIRGYRIEPGEIENRLRQHAAVKEAAVIARDEGNGSQALCAYYAADREVSISELREHMAEELPYYMVPSYFVAVERIPLTAKGTLYRGALREPYASQAGMGRSLKPGTELVLTLAASW